MRKSFNSKRPTFNQFRAWFLEAVNHRAGNKVENSLDHWHSVGDETVRKEIVDSFLDSLAVKYGFRPLCKEELHRMDCPLESVVNRIFHVFSTMFLVEHINEKMYGPRETKLH